MEDVIKTAVSEALASQGIEPIDFSVEHPENLMFGDFACNAAMVTAKKMGKDPRALAQELAQSLEGQIEYVEKIEVAGPGFLNFYLARDFFAKEIARITTLKENWGKSDLFENSLIMLEYTSPNLFKPLHVGNLVGNIVGESLARLLQFAGADVKRLNYPSDIGLTVAKGVWGLQKTGGDPKDIAALGEAYKVGNTAYEENAEAKPEIEAVNRALYAGTDAALNTLRTVGIETSRTRLRELCAMLGTQFDAEIFESEASPIGKELVEEHIGDVFEHSEGAVVYKGEKHGLHTRVFLNSQGLPTYEAKDIGNFYLKQKAYPNWSSLIYVTGSEQREYFKVIIAAIREVFDVPEAKEIAHIPTGFLTLSTGKMSSRKGNVLTGESILGELKEASLAKAEGSRADDVDALAEEVAVAALKYQILKHGIGSDIVFDKEKSLSFEGDSGPYLQYTYARILSVLVKAEASGITPSIANAPATAYDIEKVLYRFEEVVSNAAVDAEIQSVVGYLTQLAGMFNTFYAHEKIADPDDVYAPYKTAIAEAVAVTLKNGLYVLGMKAPRQL